MSFTLRAVSAGDVPAVTKLIEEHCRAVLGENEISENELRQWLSVPNLWMIVAERDGRLTGYLDVVLQDPEHLDVDIRALDEESAQVLATAAEEHARGSGSGKKVLHGVAQGDDDLAREMYEREGWQLVRHSFQMRIELDDKVPAPEWPAGLTVRNARPGEAEKIHEAQMDAFADHWDFRPQTFEHWRSFTVDRTDFDPALWWLVEDGNELAGLSLNQWHFSGDPQFGWVGILGVRPPWRRRGLGKALLLHSFRDFRERGATRVGLGVDAENTTGAVRLYEGAGMRPVRRSDVYEKTL
ncbi:MAG: mycothiol synthase [Gaiellaceae bacterium]|nr:mycothiol synthase [Gaiellaceae bacterium]